MKTEQGPSLTVTIFVLNTTAGITIEGQPYGSLAPS